MTLEEWRKEKGWSRTHLANSIGKKLGRPITDNHVKAWETGTMPGADVGDVVRKMSMGKVIFVREQKP